MKVKIRQAVMDDWELVYYLRYELDESRENSLSREVPSPDTFRKYFSTVLCQYYIIGNDYGFVKKGQDGMIGIVISRAYRGKGLATYVLDQFLDGRAIIKEDNISSMAAFSKAGFKLWGYYFVKE